MGWNPLKDVTDFLDPNAPAKEANKFEKDRLKKLLALIEGEKSNQGIQFGKAESAVRSQLPIQRKIAADARANLALTADRTKRTLLDREKAQLATGQGAAFRAGGIGSNVAPLVSRGVRGDTTRAMQQLDDLFAQHFGRIDAQEADATSQLYNQIAGLKTGRAASGLALTGQAVNAQGSQQLYPSGGAGAWLDLIGKGAKAGASLGLL